MHNNFLFLFLTSVVLFHTATTSLPQTQITTVENTQERVMTKRRVIFITGASGSGKTAITKALQQYLPLTSIFYHFDDIGIPSLEGMITVYGSPAQWQQAATDSWIEKIHTDASAPVIILEGSFNPEFGVTKCQKLGIKNYLLICLHVEKEIRNKRLITLRNSPELATQDMENFAQVLKQKTKELNGVVIDSGSQTVDEIAQEIAFVISKTSTNT